MARGKQTCRILKEIRRQIAEANDIEFVTTECRYKGDCLGTCPKCEAEVRYLEQQLRQRSLMGRTVALAGISAGVLSLMLPSGAQADNPVTCPEKTVPASADSMRPLAGVVEQVPQFPGGEKALLEWIRNHVRHPESWAKGETRVIVQFKIDKTGKVDTASVKVLRSVYKEFDNEAVRVVKELPRFIPGRMNGEAVATWYTLPIRFGLATPVDTTVKGVALDENGEPLIGATIRNLTRGIATFANIDGIFEVGAEKGDSLEVSFVGYDTKKVVFDGNTVDTLVVKLKSSEVLMGEVVTVGAIPRPGLTLIDGIVVNEKGRPIEDVDVSFVRVDDNGEPDFENEFGGDVTGDDGSFECDGNVGDIVVFTKNGYKSRAIKIKEGRKYAGMRVKLKKTKVE